MPPACHPFVRQVAMDFVGGWFAVIGSVISDRSSRFKIVDECPELHLYPFRHFVDAFQYILFNDDPVHLSM